MLKPIDYVKSVREILTNANRFLDIYAEDDVKFHVYDLQDILEGLIKDLSTAEGMMFNEEQEREGK